MSNRDRAAQVIRTWQQRHKTQLDNNTDWAAQNLAGDLHEAGLLAPDLPEPAQSFSDGTKGWFVEDDEGRDIGSIYIFNGEILLRTAAGRVKGAPSQMRKIGLALLAAANHAEEESCPR